MSLIYQQFKMLKICKMCFSIISVQNLQIPPGCYSVQADLETRNSSDNRVGRTLLVAGDEVPVAGSHHREELQQVVKAVKGGLVLDLPGNTGVK